ncbi:MAG TPA: GNAT family N-acetyltransferase [Thermoplasmata archaeon]
MAARQEKNVIRPLTAGDCSAAAKFVAKTGRWTWERYLKKTYPKEALEFDIRNHSYENLAQEIKDPEFFGFLASTGDDITGLVLGRVFGKSGFGVVNWITVDPEHQHEGIGIALMTAVEEHLRKTGGHKISLYALPALQPAIKLYMKFGLLPEAFLKQQWWGVDFLQMSKWIGKYGSKK